MFFSLSFLQQTFQQQLIKVSVLHSLAKSDAEKIISCSKWSRDMNHSKSTHLSNICFKCKQSLTQVELYGWFILIDGLIDSLID